MEFKEPECMEFKEPECMEFKEPECMEFKEPDSPTTGIYHINVSYLASGPWEESTWDEGYYALIKTDDLQKLINTSKDMQWKYTTEGGKGKSCRITIASYKYIGILNEENSQITEDYHEVTILYQSDQPPKTTHEINISSTKKEIYRDSVLFALDCYVDEIESDSDYGACSPQSL